MITRNSMKLSCLIILFLMTSFNLPRQQVSDFLIHIKFIDLPDLSFYDYLIDENQMSFKRYAKIKNGLFDSIAFKLKKTEKLRQLIYNTDWSLIPSKIEPSQIDGFNYKITILRQTDTFKFDISDSKIPIIDSLFREVYLSLPNKKAKRQFLLWRE